MDEAAKAGAILPESRVDLLGNRLVVIASSQSPLNALALTPDAFAEAIGSGRLATGEVGSVPVGRYAKQALRNLGLWSAVEPHLAMTDNVRAALASSRAAKRSLESSTRPTPAADPSVKALATFPEDSHAPILYPFALTASSHQATAEKFMAFLKSAAGRAIWEREGFKVLS